MRRANRLKIKGIYLLYRTLQALGSPLLLLYFLYRCAWDRGYWRTLPQRVGFLPRSFRQTGPGAIWLHAVSVGEVSGCVEFLRRLRAGFPNSRLFVSTSTLAGHATAGEMLRGLADGIFYAPVDYVCIVRRVLRMLKPSVVVIAETEIWPNLLRETKRTGAAIAIVNGRISDRAILRYRKLAWFFSAVLPAVDAILAQSEEMRERFVELGAPAGQVRASGNFKYDFEPRAADADSPARRLIERTKPEKIWIAASTMPPDEDDAVIAAFRDLAGRHPKLMLILAPRKPAAFDEAAAKLAAAGVRHLRRRNLQDGDTLELPGALLLDSIGELSGLFAVADVVFMGGTLVDRGGHNILEPALFAKPVVMGPHMENFRAIAADFLAASACVEIPNSAALADAIGKLLDSPDAAVEMGRRAYACAQARRGASQRAAAAVRELYDSRLPHFRHALPIETLAWPLARAWMRGARSRHKRDLRKQRRIDVPVISVGNLSMGGTGKTPCVLRVVELLKSRGKSPGILTRGYGRVSPEKILALGPGASLPAERTGDEPQIFLRSGAAPVGIGANRFETGMQLRRKFNVDMLVLDDGFQHVRLARDVDIVLIDALDPLGGGGVFPLGRLREPFSAIARADIVVITRARFSDLAPAIEHAVRHWNPHAPMFRATLEPREWVNSRDGTRYPLAEPPFRRAGAFCGLGNPESFRRTLERLGVMPVCWFEFDDHHRYRAHEFRRLEHHVVEQAADAMVTTEKDAINLHDDARASLPVYYLTVSMAIEREQEFLDAICG
jgi:3-deoxy-D-manno-octulosonic-acid transferase